MATTQVTHEMNRIPVVHPLNDVAEQKRSTARLAKIKMPRATHVSLHKTR